MVKEFKERKSKGLKKNMRTISKYRIQMRKNIRNNQTEILKLKRVIPKKIFITVSGRKNQQIQI